MISAATRTQQYTAQAAGPFGDTPGPDPADGTHHQASGVQGSADEYSAWAERLRQKRVTAKQTISGEPQTQTASGANWSTQNVFAESERVAGNDPRASRDPVGVSAAYAVLELEVGSGLDQIDARYRKLAKQHHPDRFIGEGAEVQREHADKFRAISTAREVLRQSHGAF